VSSSSASTTSHVRREIAAIALTLFAVFIAGALVFQHTPAGGSCWDATGAFGPVGTWLRCAALRTVGAPAAVLLCAMPMIFALHAFGRIERRADRAWLTLLGGGIVLLPVAFSLAAGTDPAGGSAMMGIWGQLVAHLLRAAVGAAGAWIVLALLVSALTAVSLSWNPVRMVLGRAPSAPLGPGVIAASAVVEGLPSGRRGRKALPTPISLAKQLEPAPEEMPAIDPQLARYAASPTEELATRPPNEDVGARKKGRRGKDDAPPPVAETVAEQIAGADEPAEMTELPSPSLLSPGKPKNTDVSRRELDEAGEKLMAALRTFKVDGELVGWTTGPTVTQFEVEPAAGVKVRQIATLADDLALAMRAQSIRIVAPIPGRGAVGVEVPNRTPEMVTFREIIDSKDFREAKAALPIALGKDLEGKPVIADLAKMPHLLIAGSTGSGKSVCVNTIITSLIYRHTPASLRFLMVDPKMVELSVYNDLPHLRHKVITDNRDAAAILKWAVMEMQDRYALLASNGCRNIQDFNLRVRQSASGESKKPLQRPRNADIAFEDRTYTGPELPYIVVIIDEMADLMMTVQGEVETPIAMLAQKARAIGIHLILATQRPSVNVITGLIKANFPSRIAFRVASQIDSRTIIDGGGAEMLLGNGDMLFLPPGKSEPSRLQGAYLSSEDTEALMGWYRDRRDGTTSEGRAMAAAIDEPDILETVRRKEAESKGDDDGDSSNGGGDRDPLFRDAAECVIQNQLGSTSLLQRKLKVGYGRAARIIDQLHDAGVLGPADGSKARQVLKGVMDLDEIEAEG
jgi:DNA segregation ATPase FtsK/SpoIIIE, S-DNA-T family